MDHPPERLDAAALHEAPAVQRLGGITLLVEEMLITLSRGKLDPERPETLPPVIAALLRALDSRGPFTVVLAVPDGDGDVDRWTFEVTP